MYVADDVDAFAACYAGDVVITDLTGKRAPIVSLAALRDVYGGLFKRMSAGFQSGYLRKLVNAQVVVVSKRTVSGMTGATPGGIAMFEVRRGRIIRAWFGPFEYGGKGVRQRYRGSYRTDVSAGMPTRISAEKVGLWSARLARSVILPSARRTSRGSR